MSMSERNTPSHGHRQRPPPDVDEALSSMLWTPYERTPMPSSSEGEEEDDDERLNRKLRKSQSSYETSTLSAPQPAVPQHRHHQHHHHQPQHHHQHHYPALLPPVPSFTHFSLSAFDAAIAGINLTKSSVEVETATANGRDERAARNRFSYPFYYGSPAHTLTQWCSSATTAVKEPPSYESLYVDSHDGNTDGAPASLGAATSVLSLASVGKALTPASRPCDRSQRSPKLTADVPAERLVRSFTDDYISQNCASFTPAINNNNNPSTEIEPQQQQKQPQPTTNARSQQSKEKANCIINEQREMAATPAATATATAINEETSPGQQQQQQPQQQVNQPVSCESATATVSAAALATTTTATTTESINERVSNIGVGEANDGSSSSTNTIENSSVLAASNQVELEQHCRTSERAAISLSSTFAPCTTNASNNWKHNNNNNSSSSFASSSVVLRPNKCLAELERLYAEFRASESRFERELVSQQQTFAMRLNVPAAGAASAAKTPTTKADAATATTSSVFLSNSNNNNCNGNGNQVVESISNNIAIGKLSTSSSSCQRQPSLTIQVNNGNNNGTNNGNPIESSIVNNNNGVCVVNCNYTATSTNTNTTPTSNSNSSNICNNNNNNNNNSVVEINNSVPVFSASLQNKLNNLNNNDSNVVGATNTTKTSIQQQQQQHVVAADSNDNSVNIINVNAIVPPAPARTFTSTECQTDDQQLQEQPDQQQQQQQPEQQQQQQLRTREQRRRERRERRQQQQQQSFPPLHPPRRQNTQQPQLHPPPHLHHQHPHPHPHPHPHTHPHPAAMGLARALLPDILHPHYPPPYSALPVPVPLPMTMPVPVPVPVAVAPQSAIQQSGGGAGQQQQQQPPPPPPPQLTPVISTVPLPGPGPAPLMNDGRFTLPLPIMRRSPSERSGKGCCGQWFAGPPLRALIAVVALGGLACALGGAALGATGLAGPTNSHLTAALLMIGVGVVLVTVSGAAWRMTAPGGQSCLGLGTSVDLGRCGRRPCSRGGGAPHGLLYPEFQHRPPPPSYQASMQEYRLRLLLLDRDRQNGVVRGNSPPPTYRSHAGSLLRAPLTTLRSGMSSNGAGGTISSSMGGSEYSLPPSYRSRNATPNANTMCSERNIETAPSGRLLANEDVHLPSEPTMAEQLQQQQQQQQQQSSNTLLTSAIVEIESSNRGRQVVDASVETTPTAKSKGKGKSKDLVTIVTISQADSSTNNNSNSQMQSTGLTQTHPPGQVVASALDQIDILAHL